MIYALAHVVALGLLDSSLLLAALVLFFKWLLCRRTEPSKRGLELLRSWGWYWCAYSNDFQFFTEGGTCSSCGKAKNHSNHNWKGEKQ